MKSCIFCGASIQRNISIDFIFSFQKVEENHVCQHCLQKFERLADHSTCSGCNRKQIEKNMCMDCQKWSTTYKEFPPNHHSIFTYNEIAREYMSRFKFQGDVVLGKLFKEVLANELKKKSETHVLIPIPISPQANEIRGFNQVEILLREANLPFQRQLIHTGGEKKQSSKTKNERLQSTQPFELKDKTIHFNEQPILIIDDVYTTGRTIYHARNLLETMGETTSFSLFR